MQTGRWQRGNGAARRCLAAVAASFVGALLLLPPAATAQITPNQREEIVVEDEGVQLDFNDVELSVVIDTIARLTGKNFIYDDRVRGRVTIVSPSKISIEQAYAVFESVLQVKGFTTVTTPGGVIKVIPIREAKESNIETVRGARATPDSDRFVTRLIPLRYIDAEAIAATLKPLVSKDASLVAYSPTNTVILTDSASNIRRILAILDSIDVESYKEELAVIKVVHADAGSMANQLSEIFGAEVSTSGAAARRTRARRTAQPATPVPPSGSPIGGAVRILTDERTNSLIVLTSRQRMLEIREVVAKLDVPVSGGGRVHVYYLKHADAEELAATLNSLVSGQSAAPAGGRGAAQAPQALRAAITELSEGVTVTADPPTNSLVIQASQEGFNTLSQVIALLDIQRPQVLVEALIMEVDVTDNEALGFTGIVRFDRNGKSFTIGSLTDGPDAAAGRVAGETDGDEGAAELVGSALTSFFGGFNITEAATTITGLIRATASDNRTNIVSAPHILTSDNEEAEIKVGDNIPIVTSRVTSASTEVSAANPATSVNVERQDIGVTLRVTPQISEGDTVRLQIFQEITVVNPGLTAVVSGAAEGGSAADVGVSLSKRNVENTVVVNDGETVVIGGLLSDNYQDTVDKVPFLGDIPFIGWFFKSTSRQLVKQNLLVFLTPHVVRTAEDLEEQTIRKREEFYEKSQESLRLSDKEKEERDARRLAAEAAGIDVPEFTGSNPVRGRLAAHSERYPVERMLAIERAEKKRAEEQAATTAAQQDRPRYGVLAAVFRDEAAATGLLTELVDAGYDGTLVSSESEGTVLLELRLGPYDSLSEAEEVAETVRRSFGVTPTVFVERNEE